MKITFSTNEIELKNKEIVCKTDFCYENVMLTQSNKLLQIFIMTLLQIYDSTRYSPNHKFKLYIRENKCARFFKKILVSYTLL